MSFLLKLITPSRKRKLRKLISPFRNKGIEKEFTILSNDCWGGIQYDKLGAQYTTPTVGLHIPIQDYVKFCSDLKHYLRIKPVPIVDDRYNHHLKARIDDITIEFVHYQDINVAIEKWERRKKRIVWDNIIVKYTDEHGEGQVCTEATMAKFNQLPYKKILFYSFLGSNEKYPYAILLPEHDDKGFILDEFKQADKRFTLNRLKQLINQ